MARIINNAGMALIKTFEGLRLKAYRDVAGIWTIGYGHTRNVSAGMTFTQEQADQALDDDMSGAEDAVTQAMDGAATTDNQFAAMVSLSYNIGSENFAGSTVLRKHRSGDTQAAAAAFLMWDEARIDGALRVMAGLTRRREAERALYLTIG